MPLTRVHRFFRGRTFPKRRATLNTNSHHGLAGGLKRLGQLFLDEILLPTYDQMCSSSLVQSDPDFSWNRPLVPLCYVAITRSKDVDQQRVIPFPSGHRKRVFVGGESASSLSENAHIAHNRLVQPPPPAAALVFVRQSSKLATPSRFVELLDLRCPSSHSPSSRAINAWNLPPWPRPK